MTLGEEKTGEELMGEGLEKPFLLFTKLSLYREVTPILFVIKVKTMHCFAAKCYNGAGLEEFLCELLRVRPGDENYKLYQE